jgi:hypothetical protein
MNLDELIATEELCVRYKVEYTFIRSLYESGLIEIVTVQQKEYVPYDRVAEFEKLRRLHYELDINLEGIEAIQHLLTHLKKLQKDNRKLRNRLSIFEK